MRAVGGNAAPRSSLLEPDQREPGLGVVDAPQMSGRLGEDDLERRPHARLEKMPAARAAVAASQDDVGVHLLVATVLNRDVADQREHLDLLLDRSALVVFSLPVEVAEQRTLEGSDRAVTMRDDRRGRFIVKIASACVLCAISAALPSRSSTAAAATSEAAFPSRPVRIIDAFAAGGGTDIMARLIGERLTESVKQPIVVDNRPGAGGNVGAEIAAKASPDGHTLFLAAVPAVAPSATLYPRLAYNALKDFAYVTLVASGTYVLFVQPALHVRSVADLIAAAKASPGKLSYGSTGVGGPAHLAGELLKSRAGVDILHVAYKGTPPILAAVSAGAVHLGYLTLAGVLPSWKAGRINALAVTSAKRVKGAPELPTIAESGLPGYDVTPWYGMLVPAGTGAQLVKRLNAEIGRILQTPDIQEKFAVQGLEATASTPEQFRQIMRAEIDKWAKVIKQAGIKAQ